jgi:thymidine phosphorylase
VLIDIPVGATAKVRSSAAAQTLAHQLQSTARAMQLTLRVLQTDGSAPVGFGIGPALEARDVLAVLRQEPGAPPDLAQRALLLAGHLLEMGGAAPAGAGRALADRVLADGRAWRKFQEICAAQGGMRTPVPAAFRHTVVALRSGRVLAIDNRRLARIAKLAGAPQDPGAGLDLHVRVGEFVERGQPLFTLHAASPGELAYALDYACAQAETVHVSEDA